MKLKVMVESGGHVPTRAHKHDAGLDLYAVCGIDIPSRGAVSIDTYVHVAIPEGYVGFVKSKSSLMMAGLTTDGTIDSGYTGSIRVILFNHADYGRRIAAGQKIAQLVILPIITPEVELVGYLDQTERGNGGFGSTGKF